MVLRIQGLTVGKLQTSFSRDIGCQNLNTLIMNCECCYCYRPWTSNLFSYLWNSHAQLSSPGVCSKLFFSFFYYLSRISWHSGIGFCHFNFGANIILSQRYSISVSSSQSNLYSRHRVDVSRVQGFLPTYLDSLLSCGKTMLDFVPWDNLRKLPSI